MACSRKLCPQMSSCAEAYYYYHVCRHTERDADGDGIPCENVCGKTKIDMIALLKAMPIAGFDFAAIAEAAGPAIGPDRTKVSAGTVEVTHDDRGSGEPASPQSVVSVSKGFACGTKRTCSEMTSCAEACFHLTQCGVSRLDGDRDGIPCNRLCSGQRCR
ncbi:MAG: excalibur calcium-binding domain-containing protein [Hyphomicrobiaceae bacterium]